MSREDCLQSLLKNRHIWRPGDLSSGFRQTVPSGDELLDRRLGGGWPVGMLTELLLSEPGIGELRLLMPALSFLLRGEESGQVAWIAPPYIPYAPALATYGLDVARMLVVRPERQLDSLWSMEQALRSSACVAVLGWFADIDQRAIRRLQLAAESGACWAVIFRHTRFAATTSPAPLRIRVAPEVGAENIIALHILRNRYGALGSLSLQC